jgi:hypothetical protein
MTLVCATGGGSRGFAVVVMRMAVVLVITVPMRVAVDRAADDFQAVMMPGVRRENMQPLPKKSNPAVRGEERQSQKFPGRRFHGTNGQGAKRETPASPLIVDAEDYAGKGIPADSGEPTTI